MRNCFVPGCDAACKKSGKTTRKMFLAPATKLEEWTARLPKKRVFKAHDRVCELHFKPEDVIEFWETNINGEIHRTPRNKPKLRAEAVPSINLPSIKESPHRGDIKLSERSEKIEILSHKIVVPSKRKLPPKTEKNLESPKKVRIIHAVPVTPAKKVEPAAPEPHIPLTTAESEQKQAAFETLYDEAFDVTLPSLLWGIHRDPDRKFVAFSKFNPASMMISTLLHISDQSICTTRVNSELKPPRNLELEQLGIEHVSTLLDELDKEAAT